LGVGGLPRGLARRAYGIFLGGSGVGFRGKKENELVDLTLNSRCMERIHRSTTIPSYSGSLRGFVDRGFSKGGGWSREKKERGPGSSSYNLGEKAEKWN